MESIHPATPWVCGMGTPSVHPLLASIGWSSPHPRVPATLPPYRSPDLWNPHSACLQGPTGMKGVWTSALSSSCLHTALLALCPPPWPLATFTHPRWDYDRKRNLCVLSYVDLGFVQIRNQPSVTKTSSSGSPSPGSAREETGWASAQAPGWAGREPAPPGFGLRQGHTTTTHHNRGSTNSQKTLLFQVAKRYWFLWGPWQGGGRRGVGLGSTRYKNQRLL